MVEVAMGGVRTLLGPKKESRERLRTLNVSEGSYRAVSRVAKETGVSRPRVLDAFIETAVVEYQKALNEQKKER